MVRYLLRFDDVTCEMAWSKFAPIEAVMRENNIRPIIGVVPKNEDPSLRIESGLTEIEFWQKIREYNDLGWAIAQHGYRHVYTSKDSGILGVSENSEFCCLSLDQQLALIDAGKKILEREKVWQPLFMAPSHSFDEATLNALVGCGFKYITDGYGIYPYRLGGLIAVPQLFSTPKSLGFGIYTICLHINTMNKSQIDTLIRFVKDNKRLFITFEEAIEYLPKSNILVAAVIRNITAACIRMIRLLKRIF